MRKPGENESPKTKLFHQLQLWISENCCFNICIFYYKKSSWSDTFIQRKVLGAQNISPLLLAFALNALYIGLPPEYLFIKKKLPKHSYDLKSLSTDLINTGFLYTNWFLYILKYSLLILAYLLATNYFRTDSLRLTRIFILLLL